jgi:ATP-dependent Clp endopeptidase proteolytic subunit ClpP
VPDDRKKPEYVHKAEERKLLAEARKLEAEAETWEHDAVMHRIRLDKLQREEQMELSTNIMKHVYYFNTPIGRDSAQTCVNVLDHWHRIDPACDMEIVFSSPGGSVVDGMHLFDHIRMMSRMGHKVTVGTEGYAASMAGILLQAGDHRWMGREAWVLIHQVSGGAMGTFGEITDTVKWMERYQQRILDIFAERSARAAEAGTAEEPLTREQFEQKWERTDWWLSSDECLRYGVVDEVR